MIRLTVDAMGGDNAPGEIVKGVIGALSRCSDLKVFLVGPEDQLTPLLKDCNIPRNTLEIVHAAEVISSDDNPGLSIRRKKNASMVISLNMVNSGDADAVLSAGNTGALMAGALLFMGRINGVSRPALLATVPVFEGKNVVILDVGANMDASPGQMVQYAFMGHIYARRVLERPAPSVALLNVGTEKIKGNDQVKKAHELFKSHVPGFYGNIEADRVFRGGADVVICDGFVGNVLLKTAEGISRGIFSHLKSEFTGNIKNRIGAALLYNSLSEFREKMDDAEYGGAPLIGVKGICIKCHGSSKAKAIENAVLKQVYPLVTNRVNNMIEETLEESAWTRKGF